MNEQAVKMATGIEENKHSATETTIKRPPQLQKTKKKATQKTAKSNHKPKKQNPDAQSIDQQKKEHLRGQVKIKKGDKKKNSDWGLNFWGAIPYMLKQYEYKTPYAQHVFKRVQNGLAVNSYLAEVYPSTRNWSHWDEIRQCVQTLIDSARDKANHALDESEKHVEHMMDLLGLDSSDVPEYLNTFQVTYAVTTPRVKSYLTTLERYDRLVQMLDGLWMAEGGADSNYVRHESLRLRTAMQKYVGAIYRQSDRVRRVINHKVSATQLLHELKDEIDTHYGVGLKTTDEEGDSMLLEGEKELLTESENEA